MALIVEDGTGISGAESYASLADANTYWNGRQHSSHYTSWNGASTAQKEGALREASAYLDAVYGPYYRGNRRGYIQGLLWPRSDATDDRGYELPALPDCLVNACYELAARAIDGQLAEDLDRGGAVKREKVGPIEVEYADSAPVRKTYGAVNVALSPILNGSQPSAPNANWNWA